MSKLLLKFTGDEKYYLEYLLNLSYQDNEEVALFLFSLYGIFKKMHIDEFSYYLRLMKGDRIK